MFNKALLPGITWAVFIYILCALPGSSLPSWEWADLLSIDKLVHCLIFFVLATLLMKGWELNNPASRTSMIVIAFLCILYGVFLEVLQEYVFTDRTGSVPDLIANGAGSILGLFFFGRLKNYKWLTILFRRLK